MDAAGNHSSWDSWCDVRDIPSLGGGRHVDHRCLLEHLSLPERHRQSLSESAAAAEIWIESAVWRDDEGHVGFTSRLEGCVLGKLPQVVDVHEVRSGDLGAESFG